MTPLAAACWILWSWAAGSGPPTDVVWLPAVTYPMGSERQPDERPIHPVTVPAFGLDRREVRLAEYRAFAPGGYGAGPNHPVVGVTYAEAEAYCQARGARLPSEEEWERACAASSGGPYPWGAGADRPAVWWIESQWGKHGLLPGITTTETADPSTASPEGVLELAGSVWEWTSSAYHRDSYTDPSLARGSPWKALRGGSYANLPSYATCSHREPARPETSRLTVGFRCAWSAAP